MPDRTSQSSDRTSQSILTHLRQAAALRLWQLEAVRVETEAPFRLASGNYSPIYINCRRAISDPAFMQLFATTARLIIETAGLRFSVVAGGETAGIPFAAYLASSLSLPMIYVRKKAKAYGIASRVEGHLAPEARVLLVEDLITDGGSKLSFLDALEESGATVADALVLFDREQGGATLLAARQVALHAVTDRSTTLTSGEGAGHLTPAARASVDAYFGDPAAWHWERGFSYEET